jgi:hypothetical protein
MSNGFANWGSRTWRTGVGVAERSEPLKSGTGSRDRYGGAPTGGAGVIFIFADEG